MALTAVHDLAFVAKRVFADVAVMTSGTAVQLLAIKVGMRVNSLVSCTLQRKEYTCIEGV